jgi:hypothetical protein
MIDWSIKVGDIATLVGLAGTCVLYAYRSGKFAESMEQVKKQLEEMKDVAKDTAKLLTQVAVQNTRLDNFTERQNMTDKRVEDLRRGNGWITGGQGIDKEYIR